MLKPDAGKKESGTKSILLVLNSILEWGAEFHPHEKVKPCLV